MLRETVSGAVWPALLVLLLSFGPLTSRTAGSPINVQLYSGISNPIYVNAGTVAINFSYLLAYGGRGNPTRGQAQSLLVYSTSGELLATLPLPVNPADEHQGAATVTWNNPTGQFIKLSGDVYVMGHGNNFFQWWYLPERASVASGGDTPKPPTGGVATQPQPPQQNSTTSNVGHSNIHAVIISGLSDPTKVIASPNVTLTGGIVALGKVGLASLLPSLWSPGLRVLPDYDLLTGTKIPPVTPNIIDVRIVRQQVVADFPSAPTQNTGN